jgi:AraC family transcriptional regulator
MQQPRIEMLEVKYLLGNWLTMSLASNRTRELWSSFMPRRKEIEGVHGIELYSVDIFKPGYFEQFNPDEEFEKWACVEVKSYEAIPEGMHPLTLPVGKYAIFIHHGPASKGPETYAFIFGTWLPASGHSLDDRPHLAVMGEKYRNEQPDSEEEIWIPIK